MLQKLKLERICFLSKILVSQELEQKQTNEIKKKKAENQPSKGNSQKSTKKLLQWEKNEKMLVMYFDKEMMSQKHQ